MKRIKKGNDIHILWRIFEVGKGAEQPYDLEGKKLTVYLSGAFKKEAIDNFSVYGNSIVLNVFGKDGYPAGKYSLTLIVNECLEGMFTVEQRDVFEIVNFSCMVGGEDEGNVEVTTIELKGTTIISGAMIAVDDHLSATSVNPVQNKVLTAEFKKTAQRSDIPTKTSQLNNDSGFIKKSEVPTPDWNASTYKEGHIKNRTHHMQDYMCYEFKGSPVSISKPNGTGYVLLTYDTDMAEKYMKIEIKAGEYKTEEFVDAMGLPTIFTWDGSSTINVQTFGGALETYGMRAYYSSSAKGYDEYFVALDEGFIPKTIARKTDIPTKVSQLEQDVPGGGGSYDDTEIREQLAELSAKTEHIESEGITDFADEIILEDNNGDEVGSIGAMTEETFASEQRWESNDGSEVYAKIDENGIDGKVSRIIPTISIPSVVEPSDDLVDEGYSSPIGRNNVKRADWAAENKYTYYDFLAHYYDGYLGETDDYSVTKRSLGSDASNSGYELFEYDFCPLNYKKVVMISAGMNTCETGALWGLVTFIKAMMTSDEEGFKFLRENVRFKVLPMICPSSFDKDTLAYPNANGVRINKNFDYRRMWYDVPETNKGEHPDSEVESRILKAWLNENAWKADLYIDCHQDPDKNASQVNDLTIVICSDSATNNKLKVCFPSLVQFYRNKGYIGSGVTPNTYSWVESGTNYPKTKYAKETCGIPAIMIEQYCSSTMYGSDGNTINDAAGIKNYATMLRLYTFAILADEKKVINCGSISRLK